MEINQFIQLLKSHDWSYQMGSGSVYYKGRDERAEINRWRDSSDEHKAAFNKYDKTPKFR